MIIQVRLIGFLFTAFVRLVASKRDPEGENVARLAQGGLFSGLYNPNIKYSAETYAGACSTKKIDSILNLEGASFAIVAERLNLMTRDYFDFQVVHLSSTLNQMPDVNSLELQQELLNRMDKTIEALKIIEKPPQKYRDQRILKNSIVLMAFSSQAASMRQNDLQKFQTEIRLSFLKATVLSVYKCFTRIIVTFASSSDLALVKGLGLPIWKYVDLSEGLEKAVLLPKKSLQYLRDKLTGRDNESKAMREEWQSVKYIYYTESDQILHSRFLGTIYNTIDRFNGSVAIVPHRMQTIGLPHTFPSYEKHWNMRTYKYSRLKDVDLIVENAVSPTGSCCDNGRFKFGDCGNWWYNCPQYGLPNYRQWIRFGKDGFTLPLGTEHQARCEYNSSKTICPIPRDCQRKSPRNERDVCREIDNIEFIPASADTTKSKEPSPRMLLSPSPLFSGLYVPNITYSLELYAGAWLAPKERVIQSEDFIKKIDRLEGGSLAILMSGHNVMTRDFLDFQVVHLSSTTNNIGESVKLQQRMAENMKKTVQSLRVDTAMSYNPRYRDFRMTRQTVVIIPFSSNPASQQIYDHEIKMKDVAGTLRNLYLEATIWSVYRIFPKIIVYFSSETDLARVKGLSLPIWRYIDLSKEVKGSGDPHTLPKLALQHIHEKLSIPGLHEFFDWLNIKYVYFTESDHILVSRFLPSLYNAFEIFNGSLAIIPHRMQTIALPKLFPDFRYIWEEDADKVWGLDKLQRLENVELVTENPIIPTGSCCDDGRFKFADCGNWWYNCKQYGLANYTTWARFGEDGFTMPLGTEHQAKCSYTPIKIECRKPLNCHRKVPRSPEEICSETPNVVFVP